MSPERQREAALPAGEGADVPTEAARGPAASAPPWQFLVRAVAVITGLTLLLIVDVRGVAFYFAWALIVLALATEGLAHASCTGGARARNRGA